MQKVLCINRYEFDSCDYIKISDNVAHQKIKDMSELLDINIEKLESRLNDLKDAREFMKTGKQFYLFKNNDSDYGYVDDSGENYEYKQINDKPILIDADFNLYEIIEYVDLDDIWQDKGARSCIKSWIDKIIKVKPINQIDNGIKQGYNCLSVEKIESEDINMEGFKNVAIVNLLDDYNKKDYGFALYDNEFEMIQTMVHYPAMVVVNARGKDNCVLGTVKEIMTVEEYGKGVTAQVVGVVNMDNYIARVSDNPKLAELVAELKGLGA